MELTPWSSAPSNSRAASAASGISCSSMLPIVNVLTCSPVRPKLRYSIGDPIGRTRWRPGTAEFDAETASSSGRHLPYWIVPDGRSLLHRAQWDHGDVADLLSETVAIRATGPLGAVVGEHH